MVFSSASFSLLGFPLDIRAAMENAFARDESCGFGEDVYSMSVQKARTRKYSPLNKNKRKKKKKNPPEKLNSACFSAPSGGEKGKKKKAHGEIRTVRPGFRSLRALCSDGRMNSRLLRLHLPTCSSCRMHVGGPTSTDFVLRVSDLRPACCLGSFSPIHPPLIIPACPPITGSASTSHSHTVPQAALIPSSQLQNLELSEEGGFFFNARDPGERERERAHVVTEEYGRFFLGVMTV